MPRLDEVFDDLTQALRAHYGSHPPSLAPSLASAPWFERVARVALDQVAAPRVAVSAFEALRGAGLLAPALLAATNPLALDDVLKDARVAIALKSLRPLQKLARWVVEQPSPLDDAALAERATESLRDDWRSINGIGPALADALLLGLGRASYPVDRATFRILVRHNWLDANAEYDEARAVVERQAVRSALVADDPDEDDLATGASAERVVAPLLADLSIWFERVGRDFCKPGHPRCERCPLRATLPPSGPVEVE